MEWSPSCCLLHILHDSSSQSKQSFSLDLHHHHHCHPLDLLLCSELLNSHQSSDISCNEQLYFIVWPDIVIFLFIYSFHFILRIIFYKKAYLIVNIAIVEYNHFSSFSYDAPVFVGQCASRVTFAGFRTILYDHGAL